VISQSAYGQPSACGGTSQVAAKDPLAKIKSGFLLGESPHDFDSRDTDA
jgi:hypothetical protein